MTRVGTLAHHNQLLFHTFDTASRIRDLQVQLASDIKSQSYAGLKTDTLRLVSLEVSRSQATQFSALITSREQSLELMDTALGSIDELAREARGLFETAVNGPGAFTVDVGEFASGRLQLLKDLLNSRDGQGYLFGGTRIDRPPVALDPPGYTPVSLIESDGVTVDSTFYEAYYTQVQGNTLPFAQGSFYDQIFFEKNGVAPAGPLPADADNPTLNEFVAEDPDLWQFYLDRLDSAAMLTTPKIDYYQGNDQSQVVRAGDDLDVAYDVRADELTFQQILAALDAVANLPNADASDPFQRAVILKARDLLNNALDPLTNPTVEHLDQHRMTLTRARDNLRFAREGHDTFAAHAEGIVHEIEHIDRNEVVVRIQSDQQVLEASYASLARIQSISLLEFLR